MTVYFDKGRRRWSYDFWKHGRRYKGYCVDALGKPVRSRSAAAQAEGVEKRRAESEPTVARCGEMTVAMCVADLTPVWALQANWAERRRWLKEIVAFFGAETAIREIDQARVNDYVSFCRTRKIKAWHGGPRRNPNEEKNARFWVTTKHTRSVATCELYLGTLRQIIARASEHGDPNTGRPLFERLPNVPELKRPKHKARPMPDQVAAEVMAIMPPHVVDA